MGRGCLVFQGLRKGLKDYVEDRARPRTYCATQMLPASGAPSIFLINTLCNNCFFAASVCLSLPRGERGKGRRVIKSPRPLWERAFGRDLARAKLCASRMAGRVRGETEKDVE